MPPSSQTTPTDALARARSFYSPSVIRKRSAALETLGELLGDGLGRFLTFLPSEALMNSPREVIDIAGRYGVSAWALFHLYTENNPYYNHDAVSWEQAHRPALEALHKIGGDTPERMFSLFLPKDFETNRDGIINLARKYEEALPAVTHLFQTGLLSTDIWDFEAEHGELTDAAKSLYNLTHISRYVLPLVDGGYDVSLLEEVVRNDDPAYLPGRPLALFVMNKDDPDSAFQHEYCTADLQRISEGYRLIILETDRRLEAAHAVEFASAKYASPAGSACVELLEFAAHSCSTSMDFGRPSRRTSIRESQLHIKDALLFERIGRYIVPGGHVVLNGCSTNDRNHKGNTLYDIVQRAIPHATVHAPEAELLRHYYQFDKTEKVTGVCFEIDSP